jgi:copper chaperone NosL
MKFRAGIVPLALVATFGCSSYTPMPIAAGDVCFRCRRTVTDARVAGEVIDSKGRAFKFRTAGCMAKYLKANPEAPAAVFVTDYASGRLVKPTAVAFVPVVVTEGYTTTTDYLAFSSTAAAKAAAAREKSTLVDWKHVLEAATTN